MAYGQAKRPAVAGSAAQKVPQPARMQQDQFSPQAQAQGASSAMAQAYQQAMGAQGGGPVGAPQGYAQPAQIDMSQMAAAQRGGGPAAQFAAGAKATDASMQQAFQQQAQRMQRAQPGQQKMPMNAASPAAQDVRSMQDRRAGGNVDAYGAQLKNQMSTAASGGMTPAMGAAQRMKNKGGAGMRRGAL